MPDMVFPNNKLVLKHASDCVIEFNALDALKRVSNGKLSMKVACADAWKESRQEAENLDEVKPFDWTFTTDYKGTLLGNFKISSTEERINLDKLRQRERILFYHDLTLFEDELHDNGIAVCSVKIRVMPSSFFILLRYFLRVDNVMVRLNDTRFYHEFETDFVLREYTSREAKVKDLKVPAVQLIEPSEVAQILPLVKTEREKLSFPQSVNEAGEGSTVPAT
ncbi:TIP41-like protein isoform X2 [Anabrus simplex]